MIVQKSMNQTESMLITFTLLEYSKQTAKSLSALTLSVYLFLLNPRYCWSQEPFFLQKYRAQESNQIRCSSWASTEYSGWGHTWNHSFKQGNLIAALGILVQILSQAIQQARISVKCIREGSNEIQTFRLRYDPITSNLAYRKRTQLL